MVLVFFHFFLKESFNLFSWLNDWGIIELIALKDSIDLCKRKKKKNFFLKKKEGREKSQILVAQPQSVLL